MSRLDEIRYRQQIRQTLMKHGLHPIFNIDSAGVTQGFSAIATNEDGGSGSGNWGHAGVKGQRGGSAPGGGKANRISVESGGYTSQAKQKKAAALAAKQSSNTKEAAKSSEKKLATLKDGFPNLDADKQINYLLSVGAVTPTEHDIIKEEISNGDTAALEEAANHYFKSVEGSSNEKSLSCAKRDEVAAMSQSEKEKYYESIRDSKEPLETWANKHSTVQRMIIDMGLNETPQVLTRDDFNKYVSESGATICYRGVKGLSNFSPENMFHQLMYDKDEPYVGDGIYGDGLYFSTVQNTAFSYAGERANQVIECAVRPDAKVLDCESDEYSRLVEAGTPGYESEVALLSGYDVLKVPSVDKGEDYYVVLNKAALVVADPMETKIDAEIRTAERQK